MSVSGICSKDCWWQRQAGVPHEAGCPHHRTCTSPVEQGTLLLQAQAVWGEKEEVCTRMHCGLQP